MKITFAEASYVLNKRNADQVDVTDGRVLGILDDDNENS